MNDTMAAMTPMSDHVARFWQILETENVRIIVDMRRDTSSVPYWDAASFGDDVAKALVAQRAGWQPIETAPKDGTAIWLLVDGHPYIGYGEPADWLCDRDRWFVKSTFVRKGSPKDYRATPTSDNIYCCHGVDVEPALWMPLPSVPQPQVAVTAGQKTTEGGA